MLRPRSSWRGFLATASVVVALAAVGCASLTGKGFKDGEQWEPEIEESESKWDFVGKEARGNRALENDRDPLNKWLRSDKAAEIERNLGYE